MSTFVKLITPLLLALIALVLVLIYRRMPPTYGEYVAAHATGAGRRAMEQRMPLARIQGSVGIEGAVDIRSGTVRAQIENISPLEVEVKNPVKIGSDTLDVRIIESDLVLPVKIYQ